MPEISHRSQGNLGLPLRPSKVSTYYLTLADSRFFVCIDMSKGFSQFVLSSRLVKITPWCFQSEVYSPTRLFLGLEWAPQFFAGFSESFFGKLRLPSFLQFIPEIMKGIENEDNIKISSGKIKHSGIYIFGGEL